MRKIIIENYKSTIIKKLIDIYTHIHLRVDERLNSILGLDKGWASSKPIKGKNPRTAIFFDAFSYKKMLKAI